MTKSFNELRTILEQKNKEIKQMILESIGSILKNDSNFTMLQSLVPTLDSIIFLKGWSGFNDGDQEYATCSPIISDAEGDYGDSEFWFCNTSPGDEWDDLEFEVTPKITKLVTDIEQLSEADREEFITSYSRLAEELFTFCEKYYDVGDQIEIKAS